MKSQSYLKFWQRLHRTARAKNFPLRVMFELTYRCNFRCPHCYVPFSYRKKGELKTREVFSILDQLKEIGCFYLGFTGGEPFIRKDIMKILWRAKQCGFEIMVYTNGSLINERIAEELGRLRPNKVDITIPAMDEENFQKITGVNEARKKVFQAIELLNKNDVVLGFKTCVLKENQDQIKDIQEFAESSGALRRLDDMLSPCLDGSREPYRYRGKLGTGRTLQAARHNFNILEKNCDSKAANYPANLFGCGVGRTQAAITPQGELKPCLMIDYPRFKILKNMVARSRLHAAGKGGGLKETWQRLRNFVSSIKPDGNYQCHKCGLAPYCNWCPARAWLYNRSFTSCEPESRRRAELIRKCLNC